MPRLPLFFGITLAWCCGRAPETTNTQQGDATGGSGPNTSSGGSRAAAGSSSDAGAGATPEQSGGAGSGGAPQAGAAGSGPTSGGADDVAGGGSGATTGGSLSIASGGSVSIASGGSVSIASGGSATTGGNADASAGAGGVPVTSTLCTLVGEDPSPAASKLGSLYRSAVGNDCHYAALICGVDPAQKVALANNLIQLGVGLWHCDGRSATRFHLVYPGRTVTALEAEALIDLYVTLTLQSLPFTRDDGDKIRDELRVLAIASIDENGPSLSLCNANGTWAGCAGVVDPGAGGAGSTEGGAGGKDGVSAGASGLGGAGDGG